MRARLLLNSTFRSRDLPMTTQAAEGLERRRWTVAEIEAMVRANIIDEDEHFELIGGEAVPMAPKDIRHDIMRTALCLAWAKQLPEQFRLALATMFRMSEDTFLEPDFVFFRTADGLLELSPTNALLVVEVAEASLEYDLGRKIGLYAGFGVREVWVVDAVERAVHVHRGPERDSYVDKHVLRSDEPFALPFAPEVTTSLEHLPAV